jgi:hypothetical protein
MMMSFDFHPTHALTTSSEEGAAGTFKRHLARSDENFTGFPPGTPRPGIRSIPLCSSADWSVLTTRGRPIRRVASNGTATYLQIMLQKLTFDIVAF